MLDEKETTVYKRALDVEYKLKLKASRAVFSEISKKAPTMPFTIRCAQSCLVL
jgi:methionyl aminopeptidase